MVITKARELDGGTGSIGYVPQLSKVQTQPTPKGRSTGCGQAGVEGKDEAETTVIKITVDDELRIVTMLSHPSSDTCDGFRANIVRIGNGSIVLLALCGANCYEIHISKILLLC